MNVRLVEVFCCVYEERSFSAAARKLGLSQPTISGHIKSLEQSLGTPLFDRLGRQIEVTSAGELLYGYARRIVELKKSAEEAIAGFLNRLEGDLHLGASSVPGECILPSVIGRFRELHPKVRTSLEISDTQDIIEAVLAGQIELGFVGAQTPNPALEFQRFDSDELTFLAPSCAQWSSLGAEVSLEEWLRHPILLREEGSGSRMMLETKLGELGIGIDRLDVVAELGSTTAILEAVRSGLGTSVLSSLSIRRALEGGRVRAVKVKGIGLLTRDFFSVRNRERTSSPLAEAFLEHQVLEASFESQSKGEDEVGKSDDIGVAKKSVAKESTVAPRGSLLQTGRDPGERALERAVIADRALSRAQLWPKWRPALKPSGIGVSFDGALERPLKNSVNPALRKAGVPEGRRSG